MSKSVVIKNTFILYIRQIISIIISLYTTRIVLSILGVSDYGLYTVIGGIVPLFTFFSAAMSSASQRYLAVDIGKGDSEHLRITFNTLRYIYWGFAVITLLFTETIGVWILNSELVIPEGREYVSQVVFQLSILTCIVSIISVPYSAAIIAHEKIDVYAYIGIAEVILKLIVVVALSCFANIDTLLFYAIGLCLVSLSVRVFYQIYCFRTMKESRIAKVFDKGLFKSIMSYTTYNMMGTLSFTCRNQGLNIVFNILYSSVVNAAQGIAMQVLNAINTFISNIYISTRPQIVKRYTVGDWDETWSLVKQSAKLVCFLLLIIIAPFMIGIDYILELWLGKYPPYTNIFIQLILIDLLIQSMVNQLIAILQAANKIRLCQIVSSVVMLLTLPLSYVLLKFGFPVYTPYILIILLGVISAVTIVYITNREIKEFNYSAYISGIIIPVFKVLAIVIPILLLLGVLNAHQILKMLLASISVFLIVYLIGVSSSEKKAVIHLIRQKLNR